MWHCLSLIENRLQQNWPVRRPRAGVYRGTNLIATCAKSNKALAGWPKRNGAKPVSRAIHATYPFAKKNTQFISVSTVWENEVFPEMRIFTPGFAEN